MSTISSRRALIGASATGARLLSIPAGASALTAERQETADPLIEHYRQYRALEDAQTVVHARYTVLRAGLVERYGECRGKVPVADLWERDPTYSEMCHASDESDRITDEELVPVTNSIIETPATTLSGLLAKVQVALDLWPSADADLDLREDAALAALKDTVRLLASLTRVYIPAVVAGLTTPALASAPAANADAELIRFSGRVAAVCAKMDALYAVRHTIEDEHRTQPQMDALRAERVQATDHIYDLPDPTTLAGARAMAIASIALAPRDRDGSISYSGESERLAWVVAEFLAGSAEA